MPSLDDDVPSLDELRALDERIRSALVSINAPLGTDSARELFALTLLASLNLRPEPSQSPGWQSVRLVSGSPPLWIYWRAERSLIHVFLRWGEVCVEALPADPGVAWDALVAGVGTSNVASFSARRAGLRQWAQTRGEYLEEVELMSCELCGRSQEEVEQLIAGEISVCDECLASCADELHGAKGSLERAAQHCALCGKEPAAISRFVRSAGFEICAECIELCAEIVEAQSRGAE